MGLLGKLLGKTKNAVQEVKDENAGIEKEKTAKEEASLSREGAQSIISELETISYITINKEYPKEKLDILKTGIQKIIDELKKAETLFLDTSVMDDYIVKVIRILKNGVYDGDEDTIKYSCKYLRKLIFDERREIIANDKQQVAKILMEKNNTAQKMQMICEYYSDKGKAEQVIETFSADIIKFQGKYDKYNEELDAFLKKNPDIEEDYDLYIAGKETKRAIGDILSYENKKEEKSNIAGKIENLKILRAKSEKKLVAIKGQIQQIELLLQYRNIQVSPELTSGMEKTARDLEGLEEESRKMLDDMQKASDHVDSIIRTRTEADRRRAADIKQRVKEIENRERKLAKLNEEVQSEQSLSNKVQEGITIANDSEPTMIIND